MEENLFEYCLTSFFWIAMFKGAFQGGKSEIISTIFFILGFFSSLITYKNNGKFVYFIISSIIFCIIYFIGLLLAKQNRKFNIISFITGAIAGAIKFFVFLTFMTSFAMLLDSTTPTFLENSFIQLIFPYAQKIKEISEKIISKKTCF